MNKLEKLFEDNIEALVIVFGSLLGYALTKLAFGEVPLIPFGLAVLVAFLWIRGK